MTHLLNTFRGLLILASLLACPVHLHAQTVPNASRPVCIYCNTPLPNGIHARNCPYYAGGKSQSGSRSATGSAHSPGADVKAALVGSLFQNLLTSLFTSNSAEDPKAAEEQAAALAAAHAAEAQRAKDQLAQAEFLKMMQSYKPLDEGQGATFKTLASSDPGFKSLDGEAETLAAKARSPFDTPTTPGLPTPEHSGQATPFFGDTMPIEDLQLLVHPEQDPRVVDLSKAHAFVVANLKEDTAKLESITRKHEGKGNGATTPKAQDCARLAQFLKGSMQQRNQFQKTLQSAQEQVTTWETANRNALLNAAKDGLEYFSGQILESLSKRGEAAARLQRIYDQKSGQMARDGLDLVVIQAKIKRLQKLSSAGQIAEFVSSMSDWQTFMKDGISSLVVQLKASNQDLEGFFTEPGMQDYFGADTAELQVLLDISKIAASNKVLGKWVARKVPIIAGVELAINQAYNALDWYLCFKQVAEANRINGRALEAARTIQRNIDTMYLKLRDCPGS